VTYLEALKPPEDIEESLWFLNQTLFEMAPDDVKAREHAAFEMIEPGDPIISSFIEDTYTAKFEETEMAKEDYIFILSRSLFSHATKLSQRFPEQAENHTLRLKSWWEHMWVFTVSDNFLPRNKINRHFYSLNARWMNRSGYQIIEEGELS
jgi:hypothetical protein